MNFNGLIVVIGIVLLLTLTASFIRIFNKSRTITGWFTFLLKQISSILAFILYLDIFLLLILAAILIVWGTAYYSLSWGETRLNIFWNSILVAISFIYFFLWLWWTGTKNFYKQFAYKKTIETSTKDKDPSEKNSFMQSLESKMNIGMGILLPLMIIVGLVMLGVTCFGAFTSLLISNGSISFLVTSKPLGVSELSDYYLWHFLELIPQIEVTKTIQWEVPFDYKDKGIGWLLLLFKTLMVFIVIARFYTWNKWRKELNN
jgi:hypothetical protein